MEHTQVDQLVAVSSQYSYTSSTKKTYKELSVRFLRSVAKAVDLPLGTVVIRHHAVGAAEAGDTTLKHMEFSLRLCPERNKSPRIRIVACALRDGKEIPGSRNRIFLLYSGSQQEIERLVTWVKHIQAESLGMQNLMADCLESIV